MTTSTPCGCNVAEDDSPYQHRRSCRTHPDWFENMAQSAAVLVMRDPEARQRALRQAVYALHGPVAEEGARLMAAALLEPAQAGVLADLRERLVTANERLLKMADGGHGDRLRAKAEGVRLALSYLDEAMKEAQR